MMRALTWLRLVALTLVVMSAQKAALAANEVTVAGYTNGCSCAVPPDTSGLQTDGSYTNSIFSGTTNNHFLPLGGPPVAPPARNVNNLGSFTPSCVGPGGAGPAATGFNFLLRVTFTEPPGIIGSNSVLIPALISGPFVDFDNAPRKFEFTYQNGDGSRTSGSFTISVNDLFLECSEGTSALTGPVIGAQGALPNLLISEFRLRGPGGASDEFVEIYNNTDSDVTVNPFDESAGIALAASDGVTRFTIPSGTVIRARGHYLGVNSAGYSLAAYPAGDGTNATGDAIYATSLPTLPDLPDNAGIAIFNTANPANFTIAHRIDAVGWAGEDTTLYKEGAGLAPAAGVTAGGEYSFVRKATPATNRSPQDTGDNASDFAFVSTNAGTYSGAQSQLGAPGPENASGPVRRDAVVPDSLLDPSQPASAAPNRARDLTPVTNGSIGTLTIRRKFTNNTSANITRLRFRVVDLTTLNSPGYNPAPAGTQADLRTLNSAGNVVVTGGGPVTVEGTTIETPPAQPNGGGVNTSMGRSNVAGTIINTPILPGQSINVQFVFGVNHSGAFRAFVSVEALP